MNLLAITICLVALTDAAVNDDEAEFHNDRQLIEEETGGTLRLQSHGKLAKIVDLDETPCVKVRKIHFIFMEFCFDHHSSEKGEYRG